MKGRKWLGVVTGTVEMVVGETTPRVSNARKCGSCRIALLATQDVCHSLMGVVKKVWVLQDSNLRPTDYESVALTS